MTEGDLVRLTQYGAESLYDYYGKHQLPAGSMGIVTSVATNGRQLVAAVRFFDCPGDHYMCYTDTEIKSV